MDRRIAMAVAAGTAVALPLLGACGSSNASEGTSAAPSASQAAAPGTTSAAATPVAPAPTSASSSASAAPSADPAQQKKEVQAATEKFVTELLTIKSTDTSFDDYGSRFEPLMTKHGRSSLEDSDSVASGTKAVKTLHAQHARSQPKLKGDVKVSSQEADRAKAQVSYQVVVQVRSGGSWKTVRTSPKDTVKVTLVKQSGTWLVDEAK